MLRPALLALGVLALSTQLSAQVCGSGQTLLKNDTLPDVPGGAFSVSVIQGLCEGEAAGCVFDVSGLGPSVTLSTASVGYINVANANGITAAANLKIYDGITWSGGLPTFGALVLDWEAATGSSIQLTSSGINEVDLGAFAPTITSGTAVVTWEMQVNLLAGDCPSGYTTNFATDYAGGGGGCSPAQKNLIFIQGQGWEDATTAKLGGVINICPIAYAGNWLIRACAVSGTPTGPVNYCTAGTSASGCQATISSIGSASSSASGGFNVLTSNVEGGKDGLVFYAQNGRQANAWGNGTSFQCVVPPVKRSGLLAGNGTPGSCFGTYLVDLNARWCAACPKPSHSPTPGVRLQLQTWYRDPLNTSNQTTSLSNALEVDVSP